jgi:hypothetical protein
MPWEETDKIIKSGHRSPVSFQADTLKTITLNAQEGIEAIVGKPLDKQTLEIECYVFSKEKGWTMQTARAWFSKLYGTTEHLHAVWPFTVAEKILNQPLRIQGVAMTVGISRNHNIYTPDELAAFKDKLTGAPVYLEHVTAQDAVGKVTQTQWDGQNLQYTAEIYDEDTADRIRKGLIQHVSVGADYQTLDLVNGKIPHGLFNAEMSLVAVPGIPETNIQVLEKLQNQNNGAPAAFSSLQTTDASVVESLIRKPSEATIPLSQAIRLIEEVLPNHIVQRSWSLGPQRMCQELRGVLFKLKGMPAESESQDDRK